MWPLPMECLGIHPLYARLPFFLALRRKSELKQRPRLFRCAACKWFFTGGATKLKVWWCQSKIVILHIVDVILVVEISHPISFSQFAQGISILLYLEVKSKHWHFSSLKTPYFYFFFHVSSTLFIASASICVKVTSLWYSKEYHLLPLSEFFFSSSSFF